MAKVKIQVAKAFQLNVKGGAPMYFPIGNHTVDQEVADHWFVKAHLGGESAESGDNEAAADELLAELDAKAKALQAAADELAKREQALDKREADLAEREQAVAEREKSLEAKAKTAAEEKASSESSTKTQPPKK